MNRIPVNIDYLLEVDYTDFFYERSTEKFNFSITHWVHYNPVVVFHRGSRLARYYNCDDEEIIIKFIALKIIDREYIPLFLCSPIENENNRKQVINFFESRNMKLLFSELLEMHKTGSLEVEMIDKSIYEYSSPCWSEEDSVEENE